MMDNGEDYDNDDNENGEGEGEAVPDYNCADITNIIAYTSCKPTVSLENGLIETIKYYIKTQMYKEEVQEAISDAIAKATTAPD